MRTLQHKMLWMTIAVLVLLLAGTTASFAAPNPAQYTVTITNLTSGQPFTPPLLVTHRQPFQIFQIGTPAGFELKEIAENGNLNPMLEVLSSSKHVYEHVVAAGDPPPLMPGSSISADIHAAQGAKWFSFASMLICTNDGFTGVDSLRLPKQVGDTVTINAAAYDAGTEINTEDFDDLVQPCPVLTGVDTDKEGSGTSNPDLAENGVIHHHTGIVGDADLDTNTHGWTNPVVMVEIVRVE